jgi:hypothetical protein
MGNPRRLQAEGLALKAHVERAGCALACAFASSEEFEAAIIRSKRAAGVYGPKRWRRQLAMTTAAATVLLALLYLLS